ncbi:MAG TPA: SpoIID/LytB domain-containing protein [Halomicronema sp.]
MLQNINQFVPQKNPHRPYKQTQKRPTTKTTIFSFTFVMVSFSLNLFTVPTAAQTSQDLELQVGIIQRFGEKPNEKLTIKAPAGDRLSLRFNSTSGEIQTIETTSVKLETLPQTLPTPALDEKLILGSYRSFESAENTASEWKAKGIEVEISQPKRWQVWAKRDVYSTPLLRRMLLETLQAKGNTTAYLDSKIVQQIPVLSAVVGKQRYNLGSTEISAGTGIIEVIQGEEKPNSNKEKPKGIIYGGSLRLQPNAYATYTLVNLVSLETYLRGVVPHEIGGEAPYASIEAQAILARTYALRNLRRFAVDNYQLCANTHCQVYKGLTDTWPEADRAIAATTGKVLTYDQELVDALYYSTSGGVTASFNDIWKGPGRAYLQPVIDSVLNIWDLKNQSLSSEANFRKFISLKKGFNENEEDQELFRWREESSLENLNKDFKEYLQEKQNSLVNFQTILNMQVIERSSSGRALKMLVQTNAGPIEIEKDEIMKAFYAPWSTLFYVEPVYKEDKKTLKGFAFIGGGFGHGVGMSQTGSYKLAQQGWSSEQILSFYYPGAQLQLLSDALTFWREPADKPNTKN